MASTTSFGRSTLRSRIVSTTITLSQVIFKILKNFAGDQLPAGGIQVFGFVIHGNATDGSSKLRIYHHLLIVGPYLPVDIGGFSRFQVI
jgi:hypothetical protein